MLNSLSRLLNSSSKRSKAWISRVESVQQRSRRKLVFEGLEQRRLMAVVGRVVEDSVPLGGINNGDISSSPTSAIEIGGTVYFTADDGLSGQELWRINANGFAELVEDAVPGGGINPGAEGSTPSYLTNFNGTLFFSADDGSNGVELWRVGNSGVAELVPGAALGGIYPGAASSYPKHFVELSGLLYFQARDATNGTELWRMSASGSPELVEDSVAGGGIRFGAQGSEPRYLTNVGGQLFFQANNGPSGTELWRVQNGGLASLVEDNIPGGGIAPGFQDSYPSNLTNFGGTLYFTATNEAVGTELWRVSGSGPAELVEDSVPGGGINVDSNGSSPSYLTVSGGTLYFQATNEANGYEVFRIGSGGIAQVVETSAVPNGGISPGMAGSVPTRLTDVSGTIYFNASTVTDGYELWRVNAQGFAELVDDGLAGAGIAPGASSSAPNYLTNVNGSLYFTADDGSRGIELWRVPGSGIAEIVEDLIPDGGIAIGAESSSPKNLTNGNGRLFFTAQNASQGIELFQVDGGGVVRVIERGTPGDGINPGPANSLPSRLANLNGTLFFAANDGTHGEELWRITPSFSATQINKVGSIRGINALSANSSPIHPTELNGTLYFVASDGTNGTELWRLNNLGIAEIVEDNIPGGGIRAGDLSSNPRDLVNVNGTIYFSAQTASGTGIWRILPSGMAELVVDTLARGGVDTGATTPRSHLLTNVNGTLYFVAADIANGNELWRINAMGNAEIVEDVVAGGGLAPGSSDSYPRLLTNINGTLYFRAENVADGDELWRVNGSGSAELVEDVVPTGGINPGSYGSAPSNLTNFNGTLYFQANDGTTGRELWRVGASGTAELVEDAIAGGGINPDVPFPNSSYPSLLSVVGNALYFKANDGVNGDELWRIVDSNPAEIVEDGILGGGINPANAASNPTDLTNVNGTLYFRAENALNGRELWRVVPLTGVAELVEDSAAGGGIKPGNGNSSPGNLSNVNGTLYFNANDGTAGYEVWRINGTGIAELVEDSIPGGGIQPGQEGSYPTSFIHVGGTVYFAAGNRLQGIELFQINALGMAESVSGEDGNGEILLGPASSSPRQLTNFNNALYFSANAGPRFGRELMTLRTNAIPTVTRNTATITGDVLSQLSNSGTWSDVDGDNVQLSASIGTIVRNANGTWNWTFTPTSKLDNQLVQITATDIHGESSSVTFNVTANVKVLDQRIFYNRSTSTVFGNGSGNPTGSIDVSKSALRPGQSSSFNNISNYNLGLNGIVVDVAGLGANATVADLRFAVWNGFDTGGFRSTAAAPTVTILSGGGIGGSDRIKIEFANTAIRNTWLRVTLLGNSNTGLNSDYTFYFGSAVAELNVGNTGSPLIIRVNSVDASRMRQNQSIEANSVSVTNIFDINKDGRVNSTDSNLVRQNQSLNVLRYFTAPMSALAPSIASFVLPPPSVSVNGGSVLQSAEDITSPKPSTVLAASAPVAAQAFIGPLQLPPFDETTESTPVVSSSPQTAGKILDSSMTWQATDKYFASYP
jgi:ELWxxDGT repeat protein